jgi:hypothetical protein
MIKTWNQLLPQEYLNRVIQPTAFEHHTEPSVNAEKIIGADSDGKPCFYYHRFTLTDEGFDIDEFPILIDVYFERVVAWRLNQGQWVKLKSFSDRIDGCNNRMTTLPLELADSAPR